MKVAIPTYRKKVWRLKKNSFRPHIKYWEFPCSQFKSLEIKKEFI
jgi:hypothetical protein